MAFIVPPGGFAGFSQMTAASRAALSRGARGGSRGVRRRRRKSVRKGTTVRRSRARGRTARKGRKLKFGSPAFQKKYRTGRYARKR